MTTTRTFFRAALMAVAALGTAAYAPAAGAASCSYTGNSHTILASTFHSIGFTICSTHFPSGSDERAAIEAALDDLNDIQDSDLYFYIAGSTTHKNYSATLADDGYNRLDITEEGCAGSDCSFSGRTQTRTNGSGNIDEFDIAFNEEVNWHFGDPESWELSDGYTYFSQVLLHEIGHGIGFEHNASIEEDLSIMGSYMGKWMGLKQIGYKAFDHGHVRFHYEDGSNVLYPDLVLSNYRTEWNGSSYETVLNDGLSDFSVNQGDTITLTWTRMNTGPVDITDMYYTRVYLSTNETISSADRNIKTWYHTGTVAAYSTLYASTTITIPTDLASDTYYVGMIIDSDLDIGELYGANNTLVIHTPLTVY